MVDSWKARDDERKQRAWKALLVALQRGHHLDDAIDGIQVVFGLDAAEWCEREAERILRDSAPEQGEQM